MHAQRRDHRLYGGCSCLDSIAMYSGKRPAGNHSLRQPEPLFDFMGLDLVDRSLSLVLEVLEGFDLKVLDYIVGSPSLDD
jgi:hypothetical protein